MECPATTAPSMSSCLEYGQQIGSRLVGADAVGADGRFAVPAKVVRDDSEAVGEVDELVSPQVVGE